jgi:hypothetical protein
MSKLLIRIDSQCSRCDELALLPPPRPGQFRLRELARELSKQAIVLHRQMLGHQAPPPQSMPSTKTSAESFNLVAAIVAGVARIASEFVSNIETSDAPVGVIESCAGSSAISSVAELAT